MMATTITLDEWLGELERYAGRPVAGGLTVVEMAKATGLCRDTIKRGLTRAKEQGRLIVGRRLFDDITGRKQWIPVYQITKVPKGRGAKQ